jgi:hypothetical protein
MEKCSFNTQFENIDTKVKPISIEAIPLVQSEENVSLIMYKIILYIEGRIWV